MSVNAWRRPEPVNIFRTSINHYKQLECRPYPLVFGIRGANFVSNLQISSFRMALRPSHIGMMHAARLNAATTPIEIVS